ncbi:hypothetical protein ACB092_04G178200 [Castanea dentata]
MLLCLMHSVACPLGKLKVLVLLLDIAIRFNVDAFLINLMVPILVTFDSLIFDHFNLVSAVSIPTIFNNFLIFYHLNLVFKTWVVVVMMMVVSSMISFIGDLFFIGDIVIERLVQRVVRNILRSGFPTMSLPGSIHCSAGFNLFTAIVYGGNGNNNL